MADVARRLNQSIHRQMDGARFITLFLARLDGETGRLQFVNAGHNPPLLLRAQGGVEPLSTGGLLLGIFPEADYDVGEVEMASGDLLLIYSDGVTEAQHSEDENDEYGTERLETYLKANDALDVEDIVEGVIDEAQRFSHPNPQGDDITVVALRRP
jgi:sigma-B regulation protein RsbU (phosphoserine phosphatase)